MPSSRTSLWSVLPPREAECDLFAPEIAKWISIVLGREISSDLISELEKGDILCELFHKLCPEERFGRYHKNAMMDIWKRDNIKLFADATYRYGVPKSALMSYTFFESKDEAMLITSLLVFVKVLIEKQGPEAILLPESFIKTICDAYLETRVLHKSQQQSAQRPAPAADHDSVLPTANSAADARTVASAALPIAISEEERSQLEEVMRAEVNDMLNDILQDRRRTCGMGTSEEEASDDSFDEKYLPPAATDVQTSASNYENETPVNHTPSDAEEQHGREERGERSGDEEAMEKQFEEGNEEDDRSEQEQAEEPIREETGGSDEKIGDASAAEDGRSISTPPQTTEELPSSASPEDSKERKSKEAKSSGFWWKSLLVASAVASVIIAKRLAK